MPNYLQSVLETAQHLPNLEGLPSNVVQRIFWTHKPQGTTPAPSTLVPGPNDPSANHDLQLAPLRLAVELHEPQHILAEQQLALTEVLEPIILVVEVLEDHAEEEVGANVAVIGLRIAPGLQETLEQQEDISELWDSVLDLLDFKDLLEAVLLID